MPTRYKVVNKTRWRTDDLRAFVREVVSRQGAPKHAFLVEFVHGRRSDCSTGLASAVGGRWMRVRVPAPTKRSENTIRLSTERGIPLSPLDPSSGISNEAKRDMVATIAHELAHLRGLGGERDMRSSKWLGHNHGDAYAWADEFPIRLPEKKTKPRGAVLAETKLLYAREKVAEWTSKTKLANTKKRKWATKVRYYEKRLAALTAAK